MAKVWNDFQESKARLGRGSGVYTDYFQNDGKFALLMPTIETPFIGKEVGEVEITVSSASVTTKIEGTETLNSAETPVYMHRDNLKLLEQLDGKTINVIFMAGDFTGFKSSVTVSYKVDNATLGDAWQGTVKFTPVTKPVYVDNCYPLVKPTAHFISAVDGVAYGTFDTSSSATQVPIKIPCEALGTVTAVAKDTSVCTVSVANDVCTITPKKAGSTIVTFKSSKTGYADWETTTLVVIE